MLSDGERRDGVGRFGNAILLVLPVVTASLGFYQQGVYSCGSNRRVDFTEEVNKNRERRNS